MKNIKSVCQDLLNDESAQGATEYILLLVVVVGIALLFKNKIKEIVAGKLDEIAGGIGQFNVE